MKREIINVSICLMIIVVLVNSNVPLFVDGLVRGRTYYAVGVVTPLLIFSVFTVNYISKIRKRGEKIS